MKFTKYTSTILLTLLLVACQGDPQVNRDEFFQSGEEYFEQEQYREAVIQFRNALVIDENYLPAQLSLAKAYQRLGDHQNALLEFQRVLQLDGNHLQAKLEVGKYHLQAGPGDPQHYSEARRLAEEILEADPSYVDARILLGNAYAGLHDLDRSVNEMKSALEQEPGNLTANLNLGVFQLQLREPQQAEKTFLEALNQHPKSPQVHLALANFYTATRNLEKAESHFTQAFELSPQSSAGLYALIRFYLITNKPDQAEQVFERVIEADPDWREPRWGLANFHIARGALDRGLEILHGLLEQDTDDRMTQVRLAEVYLALDRQEQAEEMIDSLLTKNKNDAEGHYLKGKLLLVKNDDDAALAEFDKALQSKQWLIPAYIEKASLHLKRQEFAQAQGALNEAVKFDRNHLAARAGLAKIMAITGQSEDALQQANAVLELQPNNTDALLAQGEALLSFRRLDPSKETFQKLAELQPQNPFHFHRLGSIEALQKNGPAALRYFSQALELNPDLPDVMNDILFLHMGDNRFQDALNEVDRFLQQSSLQDTVRVFKGKIYMAQENYTLARGEFQKALEINPDNDQPYILLGQLHLKENNLEEAIREMDRLIAKDSRSARAFLLKAYYLELNDNLTGAVDSYRKTLELSPENPIAANNLAWIYCKENRNLGEALSLAAMARKQDPNNPNYADTLGWAYYKMANYTLAVNQLLFSVNNGQPEAENYYRLGMAYYRKGDSMLAKQTLRKAVDLKPSFQGADEARQILTELG